VKTLRRVVPVVLIAFAAVSIGCGDSSGPGTRAASVTGVAGDSQSAPTGAPLAFPLSLIALGSDGQPAQGVHVSWSVTPAGEAAFTPATSVSDANGQASTTVTLGRDTGMITIQASVPGVSPVIYHATILNPCNTLLPLTLGQTANGALSTTDCVRGSWYYDFYDLSLASGQQNVRISMHADTFDTYVDLWSGVSPFPRIGFDDDSVLGQAGARNSQLDVILPAGDYIIGANSYNQFDRFSYSLAATSRSAAMNGCREVWVVRGISIVDGVSTQDCHDSTATPHYYDVARIFGAAGTGLTISERSTVINPSLSIYRLSETATGTVRQLVASNDDSSAGNPNAFIHFTVDSTNYYDVIIGTSAVGETGAYTFSIDTTKSPSPPSRVATNAQRHFSRFPPDQGILDLLGLRAPKH